MRSHCTVKRIYRLRRDLFAIVPIIVGGLDARVLVVDQVLDTCVGRSQLGFLDGSSAFATTHLQSSANGKFAKRQDDSMLTAVSK